MDARIEKSSDGIHSLHFDNSGDEYDDGQFEISYCPIYGRKLVEE